MVAILLKKQLDKAEQCSTWHIRPLTTAQIEYAALDAAVLPRLLSIMMNEPEFLQKNACTFFMTNRHMKVSTRHTIMTCFTEMPNPKGKYRVKMGSVKRVLDVVIAKQSWQSHKEAPPLPTHRELTDGDGSSSSDDAEPARRKRIQIKLSTLPVEHKLPELIASVGMSRDACLSQLLGEELRSRLPVDFEMHYDKRSDLVVMSNSILFFVSARRSLKHNHKFSNDGKKLSFTFNPKAEEGKVLLDELREEAFEETLAGVVDNFDATKRERKKLLLFVRPDRKSELLYLGRLQGFDEPTEVGDFLNVTFGLFDVEHILSDEYRKGVFEDVIAANQNGISGVSVDEALRLATEGTRPCVQRPLKTVSGNLSELPQPGTFLGGSKDACIRKILHQCTVMEDTEFTYNGRSGVIEMENMALLFVNSIRRGGRRPRKYRNDFLDDGRKLTFNFDSAKASEFALFNQLPKPLSESSIEATPVQAVGESKPPAKSLLLFVRPGGKGKFMFCGMCSGTQCEMGGSNRQLPIILELLDFDSIVENEATADPFQTMASEHTMALEDFDREISEFF
uniref:3'-5' exonuclease domain-containing protein n=1 Tax=Leptocylindrus danicus TaxID=163516 RepID=A0A7S2LHL4_9STRA